MAIFARAIQAVTGFMKIALMTEGTLAEQMYCRVPRRPARRGYRVRAMVLYNMLSSRGWLAELPTTSSTRLTWCSATCATGPRCAT